MTASERIREAREAAHVTQIKPQLVAVTALRVTCSCGCLASFVYDRATAEKIANDHVESSV